MTASILGKIETTDTEDHLPIIRHVRFNETLHGGWNEWSVGCICGFYKSTTSTHYIPSRISAEGLYEAHLPSTQEEKDEVQVATD